MASNRQLLVEIVGDDRQLSRTFKNSTKNAKEFDRTFTQTVRGTLAGSGAFRTLGRQVAFASGAFLGAAGFTAVAKQAVGVASNLAEQGNKVDVVFGSSGASVRRWATQTATSMGIANDQALEAAGTFGNLFRTVNLAAEKNAELSKSLVKLAADMASFNNADPSEVLLALRSGLIGEAEPLRRFGVLLSETRVQQEALRETGKKHIQSLTAQEKVLARYNLILRDTRPAQGDFARTQDGLANATRQLHAEIRDTEAVLGQALLPSVRKITIALRDWLGQEKNQKRIEHDVNETLRVTGSILGGLGDLWHAAAKGVNAYNSAISKIPGHDKSLLDIFHSLFGGGGEHLRQLRAGQSPIGENALGNRLITGAARAGGAASGGGGRLSFQGQLNLLEGRLAAALTRTGQAEDRALLIQERHLLQRWIAQTKDWQKRRQLYDQLARVQADIKSIDDDRAQKEKDARDKQLEARRKELEAYKEMQRKADAIAKAGREWARKQREALKNAVASVRGELGGLFSQDLLGAADARKGILGVGQPGIGAINADISTQTKRAVGFFNDLARIRRRGATGATVGELRGLGLSNAALVHTIATASRGQFQAFLKATARHEKVVQQIAHADVHARTVVINTSAIRGARSSPVSQRRGRQAGVPSSIGSYIGG